MSDETGFAQTMGDLAVVLLREVSQSLLMARQEAPLIEVTKVRIRFGQPPGADNPLALRHPTLTNGWDMEMDLNGVETRIRSATADTITQPQKTLLGIFGTHPVTALKGVNTSGARLLESAQIRTIAQLAALDSQEQLRLSVQHNNLDLMDAWGKARLLDSPIPFFPAASLARSNLHSLLKMTPEQLRASTGQAASSTETDQLYQLLALLTVAIDSKVLQKTSFGQLMS